MSEENKRELDDNKKRTIERIKKDAIKKISKTNIKPDNYSSAYRNFVWDKIRRLFGGDTAEHIYEDGKDEWINELDEEINNRKNDKRSR